MRRCRRRKLAGTGWRPLFTPLRGGVYVNDHCVVQAKDGQHGRVCDFGTRAWAPSVAFDGERWVMLYGPNRLRAAVCDDARLDHWREAPCSLVGGLAEYHETLLFRSADPFDFGVLDEGEGAVAARLAAHAPEYLRDPDTGQWYVTSAGWPGEHFGTVNPGSVAIRELAWSE